MTPIPDDILAPLGDVSASHQAQLGRNGCCPARPDGLLMMPPLCLGRS